MTVLIGDALEMLKEIPDGTVQCCVTSPPYFGLRDYGVDGQIGMEDTPDAYVVRLVDVFREVRRTMRTDGICFLNLGDTYSAGGRGGRTAKQDSNRGTLALKGKPWHVPGYGHKQLLGIPWRVAFALQADGWYLRQDIIWAKAVSGMMRKGSAMPESVKDRFCKSHEYLFLLTKSPRYWFDSIAVADALDNIQSHEYSKRRPAYGEKHYSGVPDVQRPQGQSHTATRRSVWLISPQPYSRCHFAVFPEALVAPCILAGTSENGACIACGTPWKRIVRRDLPPVVAPSSLDRFGTGKSGVHRNIGGKYTKWLNEHPKETVGWEPSCSCGVDKKPCIVLDPFAGSGTTLAVAKRLGRAYIGIELNPKYLPFIEERLKRVQNPMI